MKSEVWLPRRQPSIKCQYWTRHEKQISIRSNFQNWVGMLSFYDKNYTPDTQHGK